MKPANHVRVARLSERVILLHVKQIVGTDLLVREISFILVVLVGESLPRRAPLAGSSALLEVDSARSEPVELFDIDVRLRLTFGLFLGPSLQAFEQAQVPLPALLSRMALGLLSRLLLVLIPLLDNFFLPLCRD